jgi:hypothetical protein
MIHEMPLRRKEAYAPPQGKICAKHMMTTRSLTPIEKGIIPSMN